MQLYRFVNIVAKYTVTSVLSCIMQSTRKYNLHVTFAYEYMHFYEIYKQILGVHIDDIINHTSITLRLTT